MDASAAPGVGGVVFTVDGVSRFLAASVAVKILPMPPVARVPGGPPELAGVALVDGEMIPVVDVGIEGARSQRPPRASRSARVPEHRAMLVCTHEGEAIALVGVEIVATGSFEVEGEGVVFAGRGALPFDAEVAALVARLREGRWAV